MEEVLIGKGKATGMFYHAPAGTALPTDLAVSLPSTWEKAGDVTADGITLANERSTEDLKNWANIVKRTIMTDHSESVQSPIMDTTAETMKVIFGEENVTITEATASSGAKISVNISSSDLPEPEAFLFLMKDGDTMMMLGCSKGQITELGDVSFAPDGGITWQATIKGLESGWTFLIDDGTPA